jgi:hypothetical protein
MTHWCFAYTGFCRFFLTATRRINGAAAAQMMLEAVTPK